MAAQLAAMDPEPTRTVTTEAEVSDLAKRMRAPATRTPAVVDQYYPLCIPFYREFLRNHWHTGYYLFDDQPIGPQDQLRMERRIAENAGLDPECRVLDVGCGIGGPACHLARLTGAGFRGLTPNAAQLNFARRLAIDEQVADRVTFDQGVAGSLPYPDSGRLAGEDWLATEGLNPPDIDRFIRPICEVWGIPDLGTRNGYAAAMAAAALMVKEAVDLRDEMALLRGFLIEKADRNDVRKEMDSTSDPIRNIIMEGLLRLGEAATAGAFTLGRFLAVKAHA